MVHGDESVKQVEGAANAFFERPINELTELSLSDFEHHFAYTEVKKMKLHDKLTVSGLISSCGLRSTRADAKRVI